MRQAASAVRQNAPEIISELAKQLSLARVTRLSAPEAVRIGSGHCHSHSKLERKILCAPLAFLFSETPGAVIDIDGLTFALWCRRPN